MLRLRYIPLLAAALLLVAACSSDSTVEEEQVVDTRQPMLFGTASATAASTVETRAGDEPTWLESVYPSFKVGTWKSFDSESGRQQVMDGYQVDHTGTDHLWQYDGVRPGQVLRYWDLGAFPYEFRAVTPYMDNTTITESGITINLDPPIQAQGYTGNALTPATPTKEACLVAHVSRTKSGAEYVDTDLIKAKHESDAEINKENKTDGTRYVRLPFHHLISKVTFRIFIDDPQPTVKNYQVIIKNITITAEKDGNSFITRTQHYEATNAQGLGNGTFTATTGGATGEFILLNHGEYEDKETMRKNLRTHLHRNDAFDLCDGNFMEQIPQGNVKIKVVLVMETVHYKDNGDVDKREDITYDKYLNLIPEETTPGHFTWEAENRYVYYLHIPNIHSHEIFLDTCEILPWDDVQTTWIDIEM